MDSSHPKPPTERLTWTGYALCATLQATAWHWPQTYGFWLANAAAGLLGTAFGFWALALQRTPLSRSLFRDIPRGLLLGIGIVVASKVGAWLVLERISWSAQELTRLYQPLKMPWGRSLSTPVILLSVLAEELVFRGAVTLWLERRAPPLRAAVISTLLYALPLILSGSWLLPVVALLLGSVWTWARRRSRGLVVPILSHVIWSLSMLVWWPN